MTAECPLFFSPAVSHFWGALHDTYPRKIAAIGKLSRYLPGTSEAQQRLEYGIEVGRDGCYARLTPGQYRAPSHMPFADTLCSTLINGCAAGGMGVWLSRSI
jgi:hypothetical protein